MAAGDSCVTLMSLVKLGLARLETDGDGYSWFERKLKPRVSVGADVMLVLGKGLAIDAASPMVSALCISGNLEPLKSCPRV